MVIFEISLIILLGAKTLTFSFESETERANKSESVFSESFGVTSKVVSYIAMHSGLSTEARSITQSVKPDVTGNSITTTILARL